MAEATVMEIFNFLVMVTVGRLSYTANQHRAISGIVEQCVVASSFLGTEHIMLLVSVKMMLFVRRRRLERKEMYGTVCCVVDLESIFAARGTDTVVDQMFGLLPDRFTTWATDFLKR
jgi:hypothetical protein